MTQARTYHPTATTAERSLALTTGVVVKRNRQRTVSTITTPDGDWFLKQCRLDGPRAWFREMFRGAKAKLEFDHAVELTRRGIRTVKPVAWQGGRWPSESEILTRAVPGAVPLDAWLESTVVSVSMRRRLAVALGRFVRTMVDAGVSHPDPHPGNLLLTFDEQGEPQFTLLDLHAVRIGGPLGEHELTENLILFNRWFQLRSTRADRLRFLRALGKGDARAIETGTEQSNLRFWLRRVDRYFGNNREYRKVKRPGLRGMAMTHVPDEVLKPLLADPDAWFAGVTPIKTSKSSTVIRVSVPGLGECIYKRIPVRSRFGPLKNLLRSSTVRKSWLYGQAIHDRGLPTPRPLVMVHRHRFGLPAEGYLLTMAVPGARTLHEWVQGRPCRGEMRAMAERLGRLLRLMHDRGIAHRDLKSSNILIDANEEPVLIDLVGVTMAMNVPEATRLRDLSRLAASFVDSPIVTNAARLSLLRTYRDRDWKSMWRELAKRVQEKVNRNARHGRVLG